MYIEKKYYLFPRSVFMLVSIIVLTVSLLWLSYESVKDLMISGKDMYYIMHDNVLRGNLFHVVFCLMYLIVPYFLVYYRNLNFVINENEIVFTGMWPGLTIGKNVFLVDKLTFEWGSVQDVVVVDYDKKKPLFFESVFVVDLYIYLKDGRKLAFLRLVDRNLLQLALRVISNHLPLDRFNKAAQLYLK